MNWNEETVNFLKQLHADGKTFRESACLINQKFPGSGATRESIAGKSKRLGLHREPKKKLRPVQKSNKFGAGKLVNHGHYFKIAHGYEGIKETPIDPGAFANRCDIAGLHSFNCHWPVGDPQSEDFFFCGEPTARRPYCMYHRQISSRRTS